jgi:hypothetical protein
MDICFALFIQFCDSAGFISDGVTSNATSTTDDATTARSLVLAHCHGSHMSLQKDTFHLRSAIIQRCASHDTASSINVSICLL